jgi:glycosyltransferase involved in cell wall biosynthesis
VPKYSIILPVRNGGEYIKECVNSILSQSYKDFNLEILDNNSSDGTLDWVRSLNDQRVRIYPSSEPLSIEENWHRILSIPKNEFSTLIGHDDILFPDYLQSMDELISKNPNASLYQTHFSYINSTGILIRKCIPMALMQKPEIFLGFFLQNKINVMGTGFMFRSKDYEKLGGIPNYPNLLFADFELWVSLTEINYLAISPKECFSFRLHQSTTSISSDIKFQVAFERFIYFLNSLKNKNASYANIIKKEGRGFILFYCKGLSHRLLRTPINIRGQLSVKNFINKCSEYARLLNIEGFHPYSLQSIKIAQILDSNRVFRNLFLLFKMLYSKPVLK